MKKYIWKTVRKFPNYKISNNGEIKSKFKFLKPGKTTKGYLTVSLSNENIKGKTFYIHHLVIKHFGPKKPKYKCCINHKDGNKNNNNIKNLEYVTFSESMKHAYDNNLISKKRPKWGKNDSRRKGCFNGINAKLTKEQVIKIRKLYKLKKYTIIELSKIYSVSYRNIYSIINYETWRYL